MSDTAQLLADLAKARAVFQQRAIIAIITEGAKDSAPAKE